MRVHFVANIHRPDALKAALNLGRWLDTGGHKVAVDAETGRHVDLPVVDAEEFGAADLSVAFGGDGTLIQAAHLCSKTGVPILGVYYGRFGFVTQCTGDDVQSCMQMFFDGKLEVESRMMLETELIRANHTVATVHSLNESVLQRAVTARMMTFSVSVDGHPLTSYPADGVMVSSPTGSTAYNLSAGGPILDPAVEALILTALAPHTLSSRSFVLAPNSEIRLAIESDGEAVLSTDSITRLHILSGDEVRVSKSSRVTNLVSVPRNDFLVKLSQRLLWSRGLMGAPI